MFALGSLSAAAAAPHIVYFVIDDFGWSDSTIHDLKADIPTPHMRALSQAGITFDNLYVQPVCSPTRSAIMTGRFPFRDGMQHLTTIVPGSTAAIPMATPTMAEQLTKFGGYNAHAIGSERAKIPTHPPPVPTPASLDRCHGGRLHLAKVARVQPPSGRRVASRIRSLGQHSRRSRLQFVYRVHAGADRLLQQNV